MYIIKTEQRLGGRNNTYYHQGIYVVDVVEPKTGSVNTYGQILTSNKKNAMLIFGKEEAQRIAAFFQLSNYKIIKK